MKYLEENSQVFCVLKEPKNTPKVSEEVAIFSPSANNVFCRKCIHAFPYILSHPRLHTPGQHAAGFSNLRPTLLWECCCTCRAFVLLHSKQQKTFVLVTFSLVILLFEVILLIT